MNIRDIVGSLFIERDILEISLYTSNSTVENEQNAVGETFVGLDYKLGQK